MGDFNNMTVVAASEIIEGMCTHAAFTTLALQWNVDDRCGSGSVAARSNALAQIALRENPMVPTVKGPQHLEWAMVEYAITASQRVKDNKRTAWTKLIAGLRMDGFEAVEVEIDTGRESLWGEPVVEKQLEVRRMLPEDAPDLDFRETESELSSLLRKHGFTIAVGHLQQAISTFSRGEWSASNGAVRNLYQDLLDQIAEKLGCEPSLSDDAKRQYLSADASGPFLLAAYNEWENDRNRPSYVLGLWARLHPHGGHPGLSEEDDCAFRLQTVLIAARLFMRRFDRRVSSAP